MTATPRPESAQSDQEFTEALLADYAAVETQLRGETIDQAIRLSGMQRSRDRWRTAFWLLLAVVGVLVPVLWRGYV